jgi:hypothetical protein
MAYQQMTIIASVCINTDTWNFEQAQKESGIKSKLEMVLDEHLQEMHDSTQGDVGVLDIDFEYGEQL